MEKNKTIKQAERITFWIIIFSIAGIVLISLLPWVSVAENQGITDDLFFNFEMMLKSDNSVIYEIGNQIQSVNNYLWALMIIGLIALIGATIHSSGKSFIVGQIILLIGISMIIFGFLVLDTQIRLAQDINNYFFLQPAELFPHFSYSFILLIISIVLLIFTAVYVCFVVIDLVNKIKEKIIEKKEKDKQDIDLESFSKEPKQGRSELEIEKLLTQKVENLNNPNLPSTQTNKTSNIKDEKIIPIAPVEEKKEIKEIDAGEKESKKIIKEKKKKDKSIEEEMEKSFNKALSSALKDKKVEKIKIDQNEIEPPKSTMKVRCPKCKEIFSIDGTSTDIVCPRCGKEGKIKIKNNKTMN